MFSSFSICSHNCEECSGCPSHEPEQRSVTCFNCGDLIYSGEDYIQTVDGPMCEDCADSFRKEYTRTVE